MKTYDELATFTYPKEDLECPESNQKGNSPLCQSLIIMSNSCILIAKSHRTV